MLNKKLLESGSVLALTVLLAIGAVFGGVSASKTDVNLTQSNASLSVGAFDTIDATEGSELVSVESETDETVTATEELTEEEQEWQTKLMSNIGDKALNVRQEASTDSEVVGQMDQTAVADIIEQGTEWTKIKSGDVEGYVSNDCCVFGLDALAHSKEVVSTVAKSTGDGLRVRSTPSTDGSVVKVLDKDKTITVDTSAAAVDGWVAVKYNDQTCYVCADYVEVYVNYGTAKTMDQILAEKAAAKKTSTSSANYTEANTVQGSGISYSDDDLKLLANLIYCEAGGENYECQLACGAVVVNCVKSGSFPDSIYGVIYQRGQYGPASSGKLANALASDWANSSCYEAARQALAGVDNTNGCNSFNDASCGISGVLYGTMVFYHV